VWPAIAYLLFWQVVPRIHTESEGAIVLSTLISLALLVWFTALVGRSLSTPRQVMWSLVGASLLFLPLQVMIGTGHVYLPWAALRLLPGLPHLLFLWFAASVGTGLSFLIRSGNMIPPVAAVLALVDLWTVLLNGPVKRIM